MNIFQDKNGFEVVKFDYEDWIKGSLPTNIKAGKTVKYSNRKIPSENPILRVLDIDARNQTIQFYWFISEDDFLRVRQEQKETYIELVRYERAILESRFCGTWIKSENRETFLNSEIARRKRMLFESDRIEFNKPQDEELRMTASYPTLYNRVIVYGDKDYAFSLVNKPRPDNKRCLDCIKMNATHLHLKWLLDVKDKLIDPGEEYNEMASTVGKEKVEFERWTSKKSVNQKSNKREASFSQRQIAIAFAAMGKPITTENYREILQEFSDTKSDKILSKRIHSLDKEIMITDNAAANTKLLKDIEEAKRLASGMKDEKAVSELDRTIQRIAKEIEEKG